MRHAAVTFAAQVKQLVENGETFDAIWCTDMVSLAEFVGLAPPCIAALPRIAYFHENQLTYPDDHASKRDLHFAYTNFTTALAADEVWFNSGYHRDVFLDALRTWLMKMPDHKPADEINAITNKSNIQPPGIDPYFGTSNSPDEAINAPRKPGPTRLLWAARWEEDKNPKLFFDALDQLDQRGVDFRISVLGESFRQSPACFEHAKKRFADRIDHFGFVEDRKSYFEVLRAADVAVSTARHEFFGIAMVEAVAAGCIAIAPDALAYPQVLGEICKAGGGVLYKTDDSKRNTTAPLADAIEQMNPQVHDINRHSATKNSNAIAMQQYHWSTRSAAMDRQCEQTAIVF